MILITLSIIDQSGIVFKFASERVDLTIFKDQLIRELFGQKRFYFRILHRLLLNVPFKASDLALTAGSNQAGKAQ